MKVGHNEFNWEAVKGPPETPPDPLHPDPNNYEFVATQILGIHFQVVPQTKVTEAEPFAFCISNLALLYGD